MLYVYEVQVVAEAQRKGVGKHLATLAELIAKKNAMKGVLLTSFKNNPASNDFFLRKLKGYAVSPISPSYANPLSAEEFTYEILAKLWDPEAEALLKARADEARQAWLESDLEEKVMEKLAEGKDSKACTRAYS